MKLGVGRTRFVFDRSQRPFDGSGGLYSFSCGFLLNLGTMLRVDISRLFLRAHLHAVRYRADDTAAGF